MKLLVTGALGHIGSQLIRSFNECELVIVDNLMTQRFASIFNLPSGNSIKFLDRAVKELTAELLIEHGPFTHVIHLAAITDATGNANNRDGLFANNLQSTIHIAELAQQLEIPLIFPSTTSVYGSQSELVDEKCADLLPQSPYADCKLEEEAYLQEKVRHGLQVAILRLGTIHGASIGMRFHTAVNKFIFQSKLNMPITVWRTALHQRRPYLSLTDSLNAFQHVINNGLFGGDVFNVVTQNWTVKEIIDCIERQSQSPCKIELVDSPIMNQLSYEVSSEKFESTGFKFTGSLENDIRDTLVLLDRVR